MDPSNSWYNILHYEVDPVTGVKTGNGDYFWGFFYTFGILFPMSLPRSVSALRFSSTFGVLCSILLAVITMICFFIGEPKTLFQNNAKPIDNLKKIQPFIVSLSGIAGSFPFVIFAYMY